VTPLTTAEEHELSHITFIENRGESDTLTVLINGGAAVSTTNDCSKLHGYKPLAVHKAFHDAGKRSQIRAGEGYILLTCGTSAEVSNKYVNIHCYHTSTLPVTALSPGRFVTRHESKYEAHTIYANHRTKRGYARIHGLVDVQEIYIPGIVHGVLLYSCASSPSSDRHKFNSLIGSDACNIDTINHLNVEATRVL
jgi:hypothetical protein